MEASKIREVAEEIREATSRLPSAAAIEGLLVEYVSQQSQQRRIVILADIYSCLVQDLSESVSLTPPEKGGSQGAVGRTTMMLRGEIQPGHDTHADSPSQASACSFCWLLREFFPKCRADEQRLRVITAHLEREHGVILGGRKIPR